MNPAILLHNARLITPTAMIDRGWLLLRDGKIALIGRGDAPDISDAMPIDAERQTALPGFIDLHAHGGDGHECMDATPDALRGIAQFYARHGVTSFLATTWTAPSENIHAALANIAAMQGQQPNGATIIGAHLEGPYLNPKRCGAQDPRQIRRADRNEALAFLDYEVIRLVALAPEYEENEWLIQESVRRGITVSAAHTDATYEDMTHAVELGLTQTTHTYNAMTGLHHRQPGTLGAAMALPEISCELISDNIHVHPVSQKILLIVKGVDRIILITDAVRGAGLAESAVYEQDGRKITARDGAMYLPDGTLAGSGLTMNRALHNLMQASRKSVDELWQTSSLNAARSLHMAHCKGSLEVGKDADVILVDQSINVDLTIAEGRIVYRRTP
jgi:N-acetylglucosamine-6-phosphate deacetylase